MEASHADGWNRIYAYVGGKAKSLGAFTDIEICKNKNFFTDTYSNHGVTRTKYYRLKSNGKTTTYKKCIQVVNLLKKKSKYNKISWKYN